MSGNSAGYTVPGMITEHTNHNGYDVELEYQEQDGLFWPNKFTVRIPKTGGKILWEGEQYPQVSCNTKDECLAMIMRDAQRYIDSLPPIVGR